MVHPRFLNRFHNLPDPAALSSWSDAKLLKASDKAYSRLENADDPRAADHLATYGAICLEIDRRFRAGSSFAGA
ncbi:hypothetical protein V1639_15545 [Pseudarthrobacter sp. J75]|uniref:hypothetical protein n=1 Tax=unclassified Pseudarthrobacter TaxID=2647000 RepID=UPI002E7FE212|nr:MULTISPECIES: hypothetical protein [unclassified Pseudarthrobacter]MEE2523460.1 hypothetical protein [Pseudarthrobacter sp. J47]MEE2530435.1 hypothetical protein [Pseudarthrobacter sp. J75]MEE2570147.1 hypothetical protein [Pseudarthrobacter sp. J64]